MFLKAIKLKNFKKFKELEFDFPADLTVIKALNEQGKSTLMRAITAGLFYDPSKKNQEILELKSWWSETLPEITLFLEEKGEDFELFKDFENRKINLVNKNTKEEENNFKKISNFLYSAGGFRSAKLFEVTAAISQEIMQEINIGKKELDEAVLSLITAGEKKSNVNEILKKIEKKLDELQRGLTGRAYKNPGMLRQFSDALEEKKEFLEEAKKELHSYDQEIQKFNEEEKDLEEIQKKLKTLQEDLKEIQLYFQTNEKLSYLNQELDKVQSDLETLNKIEKEKNEIEKQINLLKKSKRLQWIEVRRLSFFVGATLLIFIGIIGSFFSPIFILSSILALILLIFGIFFSSLSTKKISKPDLLKLEKEKLSAKEDGVLSGRFLADVQKQQKKLIREIMIEKMKIEHFIHQPPTLVQQKTLQKEIDNLTDERERFIKSISQLQARLENLKVNSEVIVKLEEEISDLEEENKKAERRVKVYNLIFEILAGAKNKTIERVRADLEKYLEKFFKEITVGRYQKASIDENLNFKVFSPEKGEEIIPDGQLSRGTIDQFYVAIRFAFLKILNQGRRSLILLDDPFHNFDQDRKLRLRRLLEDFTEDFQIILFTVSDEYDDWGVVKELS